MFLKILFDSILLTFLQVIYILYKAMEIFFMPAGLQVRLSFVCNCLLLSSFIDFFVIIFGHNLNINLKVIQSSIYNYLLKSFFIYFSTLTIEHNFKLVADFVREHFLNYFNFLPYSLIIEFQPLMC